MNTQVNNADYSQYQNYYSSYGYYDYQQYPYNYYFPNPNADNSATGSPNSLYESGSDSYYSPNGFSSPCSYNYTFASICDTRNQVMFQADTSAYIESFTTTPLPQEELIQERIDKQSYAAIKPRNLIQQLKNEVDKEDESVEKRINLEKKHRIRTLLTNEHKMYLLNLFTQSAYPTKEILEMAAKHLRLSVQVIQTWFKNARSKQKKLTNTKNL